MCNIQLSTFILLLKSVRVSGYMNRTPLLSESRNIVSMLGWTTNWYEHLPSRGKYLHLCELILEFHLEIKMCWCEHNTTKPHHDSQTTTLATYDFLPYESNYENNNLCACIWTKCPDHQNYVHFDELNKSTTLRRPHISCQISTNNYSRLTNSQSRN